MYNAPQGLELTVGEDMRITPVGRVMRRLKLDELPQFVNVLAGHMTLVGPRPEIPRFVAAYQPWMMEALRLKPGMTDPASIAFRNEPSILAKSENPEREYIETILPQKIRMSLDYQSARSPLTDIVLLIRTALLLFGR
jgi:lipopolysaccharide/colanic/teichoic acid biosynthesis glycosyltransferase